jgi:hypothetical protein
VPTDIPPDRQVFTADRDVPSAIVDDIEYIIYVDPMVYDRLPTTRERNLVATIVGAANEQLEGKRFILMGPGRWGSSDIRLGVRVTYADIRNTRLLVEIAREKDGYVPEVSFGTHFFQDLVESEIHHLALYPDRPEAVFNQAFLEGAPNQLGKMVPEHADQADSVRIIHVPSASGGRLLRVAMDGVNEPALGYLA